MRLIILYILLILSGNFFSQGRIVSPSAFAAGTSVGIRFTIAPGPQCSGYNILYSTDSVYFTTLYNYPGVCGNVSTKQDISYTHSSPLQNQTNYYKIELVPLETSPVLRVYVGSSSTPSVYLRAYPDPITTDYDVLNLKFSNAVTTGVYGFIFNHSGKPVKPIQLPTQIDAAVLNVFDFPNDLYIVWLTDGTYVYKAKFIINR